MTPEELYEKIDEQVINSTWVSGLPSTSLEEGQEIIRLITEYGDQRAKEAVEGYREELKTTLNNLLNNPITIFLGEEGRIGIQAAIEEVVKAGIKSTEAK